jgi:hypothetical protein
MPDYKDHSDYNYDKYGYTYDRIEMQMMSMHHALSMEIMPHVRTVIDRYDDPWNCPVPTHEMLDRWTDEVMRMWSPVWYSSEVEAQQMGGRSPLRALVIALLIFELLRRRRRIYRQV